MSSISTSTAAPQSDIQGLARKLNLLVDKIDDIDESLRHLGPGMPLPGN